MRVSVSLGVLLLAVPVLSAEPIKYNRDVKPILAENCFGCHGAGKQKGGLRLDTVEAATAKNKKSDVAAVVPKKPGESEALKRIFSADAKEVMPPPDSHKTLTVAQKNVLKRWVEEGAVYEQHWSFAPLAAPPVPKGAANPIDAFLNDALAKKGLVANAEADKPTLVRRVAFALTGLPPTPKEVDEFAADTQPGAYERMVDRYFASPHHGEEMAKHWLDIARYADTHGLHLDNERGLWPYRDWVVKAFNTNVRFDQFTVEQLAGDLLPNATKDQLVATGFNRCNVSTGEGGSIDAEWHFRNAIDRAAVASETWLGLTAGCATCHDHKFDPISQKEFYSLYAFFYSAAGSPLDGNQLYHEPSVKLATPEQEKQLADYDRRLKAVDAAIARVKYTDPAVVAALTGGAAQPDATDSGLSFAAWVTARGGAEADKLPKPVADVFKALGKDKQPDANQAKVLRDHYLRAVCVTTKDVLGPLVTSKEVVTAERQKLDAGIPSSMIFRDGAVRQAHVMTRGDYTKPGEKVEPGTPAVFPKLGVTGRATRLDFARWLVRPDHPLTARVYVNRLWQIAFGVGLVKTSSDFGVQGEPPVHPELLDWLAADFRTTWDVRATLRRMIVSDAFRRGSKATPSLLNADPENRLLARGPRFRLDAEQIRDNALSVSGLLDPAIGGKGVKPYQPDNIWEPVAFTGSNTQFYRRDNGPALYRRTMYTFYKRTAPAPYMVNLDSPNREQPCPKRDRSNTPLQALQLLNDTQHVEAARILAERIVSEGGATADERVKFAFKLLLSRPPSEKELAIVTGELTKHQERYAKKPEDAAKLLAVGDRKANPKLKADEVAAWALVASMLLNLDETLTRN
jgi:mono/diheme cytochrome c family protein